MTHPPSTLHPLPSNLQPPVRVCYIIWSLGLGGAEQVVIRLATGLDRRRFQPIVCCLNDVGPFADQATRVGIEVIALNKRPGIDLVMLWRLIRLMKQQRVDIIHTHLWGANFWGRIAGRLAGVPVIIAHEHGMQPWRSRWHFLCDRWLAGLTHRILFASQEVMRTYLDRTGMAASKCAVIPNGVSVSLTGSDRAALRRRHGWSEQDRIIVSVGRLSPEKGYEDLLHAFARVITQMPQARLVLVGDGVERASLETLRTRAGLNGQVTFTGRQGDITSWLGAADLYVQPSRREGLPLAVLEAMAAGLPVIATRVGDLSQLITDGQEGYLVPSADPEALATKLLDVLGHLDQQRPIIEAAKQLVQQRYSSEQMIQAIEAVYDKARDAIAR